MAPRGWPISVGKIYLTVGKMLGYKIPNNVLVLYFCALKDGVILKKDVCAQSANISQWIGRVKDSHAEHSTAFSLRSRRAFFPSKQEVDGLHQRTPQFQSRQLSLQNEALCFLRSL